jgi:signal transduction histidine kinase
MRGTILPSLSKIVGQTHRIHSILTELMQFARPPAPRMKTLAMRALIHEVANSLQSLALERQVRIVCPEPAGEMAFEGDPLQLRTALTALLRNAIEAAPTDGWASVRVETNAAGGLDLVVEDNGQGPTAATREHLFDPFYSGRSAGRGRGMGLPTAWRLARQHGGDVSFGGIIQGVTRFVLTLPAAGVRDAVPYVNGHAANKNGRNGAHYSEAHP